MSQKITCPNCNTEIDLDKIWEEKYKAMLEKQEKELKEEMNAKAIKWAEEKAKKLFEEKEKKDSIEMDDLKNRLKEQEKASEEMKKNELEMRKKTRELENKEKNFELEMEKKLFEEKKKIELSVEERLKENSKKELNEQLEKIQEEHRKKDLEMLKQQEQMKKTIDDLKRKSEQNSQQIQWDIQEDDLRDALLQAFPIDDIEDVPTWIKWADLIQTVKNNLGQSAGTIIWESKNTKGWMDAWVMKLKDDKLKINWSIAILVTTVLPKGIKNFGLIDEVMVCIPEFAIPVANMLRDKLISISKVEKSLEWKDMKMEMLYKYLGSQEFSSKISMMVDVFSQLKIWIDKERRAMETNWKKREKDLERATYAITWMYGELESLMWQALPGSERLELGYGEE
jgi:hypothetical protein